MKIKFNELPPDLSGDRLHKITGHVTPEFFGLVTTDHVVIYEETSEKYTRVYKKSHFNKPYTEYSFVADIHPRHIEELTDEYISLYMGSYNADGGLISIALGGEVQRAYYKKENGIYHFTGEIEKTY